MQSTQTWGRRQLTFFRSHAPRCAVYRGGMLAGVITAVATAMLLAPLMAFAGTPPPDSEGLRIGWASTDLTPDEPVVLTGQFHARVMEGIRDPVTATALALQSSSGDGVIMVSCDFISIPDELRDRVRDLVQQALPERERPTVVLNATHTHAAPELRTSPPDLPELLGTDVPDAWSRWGIELDAMSPLKYVEFASQRIAEAAEQAWQARQGGGISFGLSHAVVGHNRILAYADGSSRMYGSTNRPDFSHVEGFEDHSVNLLYTWDRNGELTGVLINLASPAQHDENIFELSADFWHETREVLRERLGGDLFVFPQCAAAGDQSERVMIHRRAESRMERITGQNRRERIAERIADAVTSILPFMEDHIDWDPVFAQRLETVNLSRRQITEEEYASAKQTFVQRKDEYDQIRREFESRPEMRQEARWYRDITRAFSGMRREARIKARFETQQADPVMPVEVYVLRLGDIAMATNPFELYLDFGIRMQERSRAIQTFVVQLAGAGTYVAPERSVAGGAYGAEAASNEVGPQGGQELVERTLELIEALWNDR
jgi:hypothetical protein